MRTLPSGRLEVQFSDGKKEVFDRVVSAIGYERNTHEFLGAIKNRKNIFVFGAADTESEGTESDKNSAAFIHHAYKTDAMVRSILHALQVVVE